MSRCAIFQCPVSLRTVKTLRSGPSHVCMDPPKGERKRPFGRSLEPLEVFRKRLGMWQVILIWLGSRRREVEKVD